MKIDNFIPRFLRESGEQDNTLSEFGKGRRDAIAKTSAFVLAPLLTRLTAFAKNLPEEERLTPKSINRVTEGAIQECSETNWQMATPAEQDDVYRGNVTITPHGELLHIEANSKKITGDQKGYRLYYIGRDGIMQDTFVPWGGAPWEIKSGYGIFHGENGQIFVRSSRKVIQLQSDGTAMKGENGESIDPVLHNMENGERNGILQKVNTGWIQSTQPNNNKSGDQEALAIYFRSTDFSGQRSLGDISFDPSKLQPAVSKIEGKRVRMHYVVPEQNFIRTTPDGKATFIKLKGSDVIHKFDFSNGVPSEPEILALPEEEIPFAFSENDFFVKDGFKAAEKINTKLNSDVGLPHWDTVLSMPENFPKMRDSILFNGVPYFSDWSKAGEQNNGRIFTYNKDNSLREILPADSEYISPEYLQYVIEVVDDWAYLHTQDGEEDRGFARVPVNKISEYFSKGNHIPEQLYR